MSGTVIGESEGDAVTKNVIDIVGKETFGCNDVTRTQQSPLLFTPRED